MLLNFGGVSVYVLKRGPLSRSETKSDPDEVVLRRR